MTMQNLGWAVLMLVVVYLMIPAWVSIIARAIYAERFRHLEMLNLKETQEHKALARYAKEKGGVN